MVVLMFAIYIIPFHGDRFVVQRRNGIGVWLWMKSNIEILIGERPLHKSSKTSVTLDPALAS